MTEEEFKRIETIFEEWFIAKQDLHCCGAAVQDYDCFKNAKNDYEELKKELICCERCFKNVCECNL